MKTTRAYLRDNNGLEIINILIDENNVICDAGGYPMTPTDEHVDLLGWPDDRARVYNNDGGREILVPVSG